MPTLLTKAVISTSEAIDYVGGERIWNGLVKHHGKILRPFSRASNNACKWRVKTIDAALDVAEASGTFVEKTTFKPTLKRT